MYLKQLAVFCVLALCLTLAALATNIEKSNSDSDSNFNSIDDLTPVNLTIPNEPAYLDPPESELAIPKYDQHQNSGRDCEDPKGSRPAYVFNAQASNNVVVYFGQTPGTRQTNLTNQCNDPAVDIVILAFVQVANGANGYPNISFGSTCGTRTTAMKNTAPGLLNCKYLAPQITYCQSIGKKVFVSLGGSAGNVTLYSNPEAVDFATKLWNLFGLGTGEDWQLRPFGNVSVDGFDLDNESNDIQDPTYYGTFALTMRSFFTNTNSKVFYLSGSGTCSWPDRRLPLPYMAQADFIFVRFYNNNQCNIGTSNWLSGAQAGLCAWTRGLGVLGSLGPKIYIGGTASQASSSGYLPPDDFASNILAAKTFMAAQQITNFGGVMLWDGTQGHLTMNANGNMTFIQVVKEALSE